MFYNNTNTPSFYSVLIAALVFSLSLAGVAGAQFNTSLGDGALFSNTTGEFNTASGAQALFSNRNGGSNTATGNSALLDNFDGLNNTASGVNALLSNTTGNTNTAIGTGANVSFAGLHNATAIGFGAVVGGSNQIEVGNDAITRIHGKVAFTFGSDKTKKENFKPVDGEAVLEKICGFELTSWNFIGHDPKQFRHYGPMAQDFYAAFGHDDQLGGSGGDFDDRRASAGEAHGGANAERETDCGIGVEARPEGRTNCGAGSAVRGGGVTAESASPDNSRATLKRSLLTSLRQQSSTGPGLK